MSFTKRIGIAIGFLFILVGIVLVWFLYKDSGDKYERPDFDHAQIPLFDKHTLDYETYFDKENSLPIVGSAILDIDNDGIDELFIGNGKGKEQAIFSYRNEKFEDITAMVGLKKLKQSNNVYGVSTVDLDNNGFTDLLVSIDNAVIFYANDHGKFEKPIELNLTFNDRSQPLSITYCDLNNDGFTDLFVSTYLQKNLMEGQTIFNKKGYGSNSELFLNNGDNTFKNITKEAGLEYVHNTFTAVFSDINNDNLPDLVVAYDTGEPRIYKNNGQLKFELVNNPLTQKFSYPMGIAVGDYDNNGFQDFMFSNVGKSLPEIMVRGDLEDSQSLVTDWILLANQGNNTFKDYATAANIALYEFSWGAVFEDFNQDGLQDLVVSENYVDLPNSKIKPLPSRFLMQLPENSFVNIENDNNTTNPCNGITPLVADFNQDGFPDLVHINLDGEVNAFLSKANVRNNYINIRFPNTLEFAQAKLTVSLKNGKKQYYQNINGEGLSSDQTRTVFIGLGTEINLPHIELELRSGEKRNIPLNNINTTVKL